jgi:hypothetical protein
MGPNKGDYYGDIAIVMHPSVLHHPDTFITPVAATAFNSGHEAPLRPHSKHHGVPGFHKCKINCGVAKWDEVLAKELIVKASVHLHKDVSNVDIRDVEKVYLQRDAHFVLEGHMPFCVPLSFAERVIIPASSLSSINASLPNAEQKICDALHRKDAVIQVHDPAEVFSRLVDHSRRPPRTNALHGFSFSLDMETGHIRWLPLTIHSSDDFLYVSFSSGGSLFVVLHENGDYLSHPPIQVLTVFIDENGASIIEVMPNAVGGKHRPIAEDRHFNRGVQTKDVLVPYVIKVDKKKCKVMLSHGPSIFYTMHRTLEGKTSGNIKKIHRVGFSSHGSLMRIHNFFIDTTDRFPASSRPVHTGAQDRAIGGGSDARVTGKH